MSILPAPAPKVLPQMSPGSHCVLLVQAVPTRWVAMSDPAVGGGGGVAAIPESGPSGTDCVGDGVAGDPPVGSPTLVPMTSNEQPATTTAATMKPTRMHGCRASEGPNEIASVIAK